MEYFGIKVNENELKVVNYIINNGDVFDDRMTLCGFDIRPEGLTREQVAGYLSDLMKKGILIDGVFPNGNTSWSVIDQH